MDEGIEVDRFIPAPAEEVFALLCDPQGHVAIDASGMLQDATGDRVSAVGDTFVVHMDRESLNDIPDYGKYDVIVTIEELEPDRLISWSILGRVRPGMGHRYGYRLQPVEGGTDVTSFYDWSHASQDWKDSGVFPVISEDNLRGTLGILDRTVRRGYVRV
jgi:hypothetical protein